ncbi:MAG: TRAP transporter small permease subunit [Pseudomonadota bacterium]
MSMTPVFSVFLSLFSTILVLPLAHLAGRKAKFVWPLTTLVISCLFYVFSLAAVDLSAPGLNLWVIGFVVSFIVAGLLYGIEKLTVNTASVAEYLARSSGQLVFPFVFLMAFVQFTTVVLRYIFGVNFIAMQESVTYLHGAIFMLASGYALLTNDHVRVDIFYSTVSEKYRAAIDLAGVYLFLFPFCLVTLWASAPYVANAWSVREGSTEQSGIQAVFLLKTLIPIFAVLLASAGFTKALEASESLLRRPFDAPNTASNDHASVL